MDNIVPAVVADREAEGRLAAEHYAERGFRSVGIVHFDQMNLYDTAFRDRALELGCQFRDLDLSPGRPRRNESPAAIYERQSKRFCEWVAKVLQPIGLLQRSDLSAARFCNFCLQGGIRVPDEVALLGRGNDVTVCDFAPVRLSSIHLDTEARMASAIGLLDDMLAGRKVPREPLFIPPNSIVTRESTDVRASQNPDVAKVLRHMWNHYDDLELSVDAIATVVGFSRRKLERLFRAELDQTVNDALLERRLERCCELLITTDINVSDLCYKIGLRSKGYLCRAFKDTYGMTLKQYRLHHLTV